MRKSVVSKDGGVDASVAQFVKWAMRSMATFIFQVKIAYVLVNGSVNKLIIRKLSHNKLKICYSIK